jgi:hypothetical protein
MTENARMAAPEAGQGVLDRAWRIKGWRRTMRDLKHKRNTSNFSLNKSTPGTVCRIGWTGVPGMSHHCRGRYGQRRWLDEAGGEGEKPVEESHLTRKADAAG